MEVIKIVVAVTIILIILIICISILIGIYMLACLERGVKMFADPRYEERIGKLEEAIKELEKK